MIYKKKEIADRKMERGYKYGDEETAGSKAEKKCFCRSDIKEDENSQIGWIAIEEIGEKSTEPWFVERIYAKLCNKVNELQHVC